MMCAVAACLPRPCSCSTNFAPLPDLATPEADPTVVAERIVATMLATPGTCIYSEVPCW